MFSTTTSGKFVYIFLQCRRRLKSETSLPAWCPPLLWGRGCFWVRANLECFLVWVSARSKSFRRRAGFSRQALEDAVASQLVEMLRTSDGPASEQPSFARLARAAEHESVGSVVGLCALQFAGTCDSEMRVPDDITRAAMEAVECFPSCALLRVMAFAELPPGRRGRRTRALRAQKRVVFEALGPGT